VNSHAFAREEGIIVLAGKVAEKRALRGSEPGWRRWRRAEELRAFHEAGHAIAAIAMGQYVYLLNIVPDPSRLVGKGNQIQGGIAWTGRKPGVVTDLSAPWPKSQGDASKAIAIAWGVAEEATWRSILGVVRRWQAEAAQIVERHWYVVMALAEALEERKTLSASEVAAVVGPRRIPRF